MSKFWSPLVSRLTPYTPGEQPKINNLIKLNTNENPYGPSPLALAAMAREVGETLRLYPNPDAEPLKAAIARRHGLNPAQVFVGNGSDEVLAHAFQALLKHDAPILFPDITYSFYPTYAGLYEVAFRAVPLAADFSITVDDYLGHGGTIGGIIFPNPNAPTGCLMPLDQVTRLLAGNPDRVELLSGQVEPPESGRAGSHDSRCRQGKIQCGRGALQERKGRYPQDRRRAGSTIQRLG